MSPKVASPTCSHSSAPCGPRPGPPTPTQPATWLEPPVTAGVSSMLIVAAIPDAFVGL